MNGESITGLPDAVAEYGAFPVPFGPQMPDFPPPPETELGKLHAERARLQGLLAEAVADAHRARCERDLMRERVSEPYGCAHCGAERRSHGRRYIGGAGMHAWERPSDEQVKDRMLARRVAGMALPSNLSLWEEPPIVAALRTRVAELEAERHSTNESLDDAVQELRRRESGPSLPWAHAMSDHDLHGFLDDLVSAAMGRWRSEPEVPDRTVLADIEKVCADWRTPGAGSRLDGSEFDGAVVRLAEPEPEFHAWLHHENRLGHDLPETGGAS
ncbi:hypothetical protein [Streptomyces ossamyceticus]|uniref:hypothetical protein n=1 Tax=Streptomyces ossamyceticus TaxID=249581 RepID=UPI0006E2D555|nr:hypothetical protein [Streptomyces ossamyceticus]